MPPFRAFKPGDRIHVKAAADGDCAAHKDQRGTVAGYAISYPSLGGRPLPDGSLTSALSYPVELDSGEQAMIWAHWLEAEPAAG